MCTIVYIYTIILYQYYYNILSYNVHYGPISIHLWAANMISEQESMMTFDDFEHYWPWLASIKSNH